MDTLLVIPVKYRLEDLYTLKYIMYIGTIHSNIYYVFSMRDYLRCYLFLSTVFTNQKIVVNIIQTSYTILI